MDFDAARSAAIGAELIGTSISSGGDGSPGKGTEQKLRIDNPHIRFYDNRRGYLLCDFDRQRCLATFRAVDKVTTPDGKLATAASFSIDADKPGLA